MTRYHATPAGNIPFTEDEEAEADAMESAHAAGAPQRASDAIQLQIDELERQTLLNRGSRELELVSMQDLANRQAVILAPSMPGSTVEEIADAILAARPYYPKLVALDGQIAALRAQLLPE